MPWSRVRAILAKTAYWVLPSVFCLILYRYGLRSWFQLDDFAFLGVLRRIHSWGDLWHAVFTPTEHGTFRPISERGFFLVLNSLFGPEPLPFRIVVFVTQFLNLALISSITSRLTGSRLAGFLAPVLWVAHSSLYTVMTWDSAYMQALCGFCLLLAFHFLLRYVETGERRYYWFQWAVFLFGFGVMETNLVYPAIAAAYTLLFARRYFRGTLPLGVVSVIFTILHLKLAPKVSTGPYAVHIDLGVLKTLAIYWKSAVAPNKLAQVAGAPELLNTACLLLFTPALILFVLWSARRKQWAPLLFLSWFVFTLGPVLPLPAHIIKYYLTLPSIGLAMLGAAAFAAAWGKNYAWKSFAAALIVLYFVTSVPVAARSTKWSYQHGEAGRLLVSEVIRVRELHPDKTILLSGVDDYLYWAAVCDGSFYAFGVDDVFLTPGSEAQIRVNPELGDLAQHVMSLDLAIHGLDQRKIVVYGVGGPRLKNVTGAFEAVARSQFQPGTSRRVDVSTSLAEYLLGPGWYEEEPGHRWMSKRASLRMGGPRSASEKLHISGFCPAGQVREGPLGMTVSIDGKRLPAVKITAGHLNFSFDFAPPAEAIGKEQVEIGVEVERTLSPTAPETRELGVAFGIFSME